MFTYISSLIIYLLDQVPQLPLLELPAHKLLELLELRRREPLAHKLLELLVLLVLELKLV